MKHISSKRITAFLMVLLLAVSMFPAGAFAASVETETILNGDAMDITQSENIGSSSDDVIVVTTASNAGSSAADTSSAPPAKSDETSSAPFSDPVSSAASSDDTSISKEPESAPPAEKELPVPADSGASADTSAPVPESGGADIPDTNSGQQPTDPEIPVTSETAGPPTENPVNDLPVQLVRMTQNGRMARALAARSSGTLHWDRYDQYQYDENLGSGPVSMHYWAAATINGQVGYCVEPNVMDTHASKPYGTIEYSQLNSTQRRSIGYAMLYGAQDYSNLPFHIATQTVIWEIVQGYMDLETCTCINKSVYNAVIGHIPSAAPYYDQIIAKMRAHKEVPAFTHFSQEEAPVHKIPGINGEYILDLENTNPNCDLNDFNFQEQAGVSLVKDGQTLHVTSTGPITSDILFAAYKGANGETNSLIFWTSTDGGDQIRATADVLDPVPAYFKLSTEDLGEYYIEISKFETGTNKPLAGAEFEVRHAEKGVAGVYTTDASGVVRVTVPWQGAYIITEITPPENHLLAKDRIKDVVVSTGNKTPAVSFHNDKFCGLKLMKVDAQTKKPLANVTFSVQKKGGTEQQTVTTGADGAAQLANLEPDWYIITETACAPGYILDQTPHTVQMIAGEICELTLENHKKPGIEITKVDADDPSVHLAGATFRIAKKGSKEYQDIVTSADGTAQLTGLEAGYYIVTEITAPNGYILDKTEHSVELIEGETAAVTLTNHKKPGIEIIKVDAENPNTRLAGATFRIAGRGGKEYEDVVTDANGIARLSGLKAGYYTVKEITAPNGYILDSQEHTVEMVEGKTSAITISNHKKPGLEIIKVDADAPGTHLAGATFRIAKKGSKEYQDVVTGADGTARLTGLEAGYYIVTEITAPDGYILDSTEHSVELIEGEDATVTIPNHRKPALEIIKIDDTTKAPLAGATFHVALSGSKDAKDITTDENGIARLTDLEVGYCTIREIVAPDGYILSDEEQTVELVQGQTASVTISNHKKPSLLIEKIDSVTEEPLKNATFEISYKNGKVLGRFTTGEDGRIELTKLDTGLVAVKEITAPDGYICTNAPQEILLSADDVKTLRFENTPKSPIILKKVDAATGEPLSGAAFRLTKMNGELVGEYRTGRNGYVTVPGLEPGWYVAVETQAPQGYRLEATPQKVELKLGEPAILEFQNTLLPGLQIRKVDAVSGKPLAGIHFRVTKKSGDVVGDYVTNGAGVIAIADLADGWYTAYETQTIDGYILDTTPQDVQLKNGQTATLEFRNTPLSGLTVRKVDAATGDPLAGAKFKVATMNDVPVGEYTTDRNGTVTLPDLEPGMYVVAEIKAPNGYKLNNEPQKIELKRGGHAVLVFEDELLPGLRIRKTDAVTGKPLEGVRFRITKKTGDVIGDYTTNAAGMIVAPDLAEGWYTAYETETIDGYVLDATPQDVQLKKGQTATLEFRNVPLTGLTICKVDAATGNPLPGAKFRLLDKNGDAVGEYTTGRGGIVTVPDMEPGTYTVVEIEAPAGYRLDNTPQKIEVKKGALSVIECRDEELPGLRIRKIDAVTGAPLAGIHFRITEKGGNVVGDYATNDAGLIVVSDLAEGWYTAFETATIQGYVLDSTAQDVQLEKGKTATLEFKNVPLSGLTLCKVDAETGEPLAGAKFKLTTMKDEPVGEYTTDRSGTVVITGLAPGWYVAAEIKAPEGYKLNSEPQKVELQDGSHTTLTFENVLLPGLRIRKVDAVSGEPLAGVRFRVTKKNGELVGNYTTNDAGMIVVPDLKTGWYTVFETATVSGYLLDPTPQDVQLKANQTATLEFTNTPLSGLTIRKVDAATGEPLPKAKFKLATMSEELIGEYTTDRSGTAVIEGLKPGWYVVTEIKAPEGYQLCAEPKKVELKLGNHATIEFEDELLPGLQIRKADAVTGKPLAGIRFRVVKKTGDVVGDYTTNEAGMILIPNLKAGWYTAYEIETIDGYILDPTAQDVELKVNQTAMLTFKNTPLSGLTVHKVDAVTGAGLAGVEFEVCHENGAVIGKFTTGENGRLFIPNLEAETLTIRETKTVKGYKLDTSVHTVKIESGKNNLIEIENSPYPYLVLQKIDSETGAPLAGAKFDLFSSSGQKIGTYATNSTGRIILTGMDEGGYSLQEVAAPEGYELDDQVIDVSLQWGKTTTVTFANRKLATLRIRKMDAETEEAMPGVTFLLYDTKNNILGEYTTDDYGLIEFDQTMAEGSYKLREIKTLDGYVLDEKVRTIKVKHGETTEIVWKNEPLRGQIKIRKITSENSSLTKQKKGDALAGAVFEIYNEREDVVDTITTDKKGIALSRPLPLGKYAIKEVESPDGWQINDTVFYAEIKVQNDLIKFVVEDAPVEIRTHITKRGVVEAFAGDLIKYDFSNIQNLSNVPLEDFYWHDLLPTDAVRFESIYTGTWNEELTYKVLYKTNIKGDWAVLEENLSTLENNRLDCTARALGLASNEYVTEFRFEFGTVDVGFHEDTAPCIMTRVLANLPDGYQFVNRTDVGGRYGGHWVYDKDTWITTTHSKPQNPPKLPKTGEYFVENGLMED